MSWKISVQNKLLHQMAVCIKQDVLEQINEEKSNSSWLTESFFCKPHSNKSLKYNDSSTLKLCYLQFQEWSN